MTDRTAVLKSDRVKTALSYIAIIVVPWLLMEPSLQFEFASDDRILIVENQLMRDPGNWWRMLTTDAFDRTIVGFDYDIESLVGHYRPISKLSFLVDYTLWGPSERAFHFSGIVLHLLCGCLLLWLIRQLGVSAAFATAATLIFVLHPVTARAIGLVSLRSDLWCGLFGLCGILVALKGWQKDRLSFHWIAGLLTLLCLFGKEAGIFLPPLLTAVAIVHHGWHRRAWRLIVRDVLPSYAAVAIYILVRFGWLAIATGKQNDYPSMSLWTLFQSLSRLFASYLAELPAPTLVDRLWMPEIITGFPPVSVWLSWVVIAGFVAAIGWTLHHRHLGAALGLGLILFPVAPLLNIWAISGEDVGELLPFEMHRLYIPAMGYAVLWALLAQRGWQMTGVRRTIAVAASGLLLAMPIWRYPSELAAYADTEAMVRRKLDFLAGFDDKELPSSLRVLRLNLRSIELKRAGDLDGAERALLEIQRLQPHDAIALKNLAVIALLKKEPARTITYLQSVLNPIPQADRSGKVRELIDDAQLRHTGEVHKLLGRAYQMTGELPLARKHLLLSRKIDPTDLEVLLLLAFVSEREGDTKSSRNYLQGFLDAAPADDRRRGSVQRRLSGNDP